MQMRTPWRHQLAPTSRPAPLDHSTASTPNVKRSLLYEAAAVTTENNAAQQGAAVNRDSILLLGGKDFPDHLKMAAV